MNDKIKNFMEYVSSNEALKKELQVEMKGADNANRSSNIIRFAKKHGYELTEKDFTAGCDELDDDELEAVVGGIDRREAVNGDKAGCGCVGFGGGYCGDWDGLECVCVLYGTGGVGCTYPTSQGGCECVGAGAGASNRH